MNRLFLVLAALLVVMASCASAPTENVIEPVIEMEQSPSTAPTTSAAPVTTASTSSAEGARSESESHNSAMAGTTTTPEPTSTTVPGPSPDGPPAPDFTLALGEDGSDTFTLSHETKPVFLIFWAEW
jgi:hypothetical protein